MSTSTTHEPSDEPLPYHALPDPPPSACGTAVMARLLDGLGFRYRWATEGLREADTAFRPGEGSMTLHELLRHICRLMSWLDGHLDGRASDVFPEDLPGLRRQTLAHIVAMRTRLASMSDARLGQLGITGSRGTEPFWNMLNGPLADALTHVGQINAWRRLAGNPAPRVDVFRGRPPAT